MDITHIGNILDKYGKDLYKHYNINNNGNSLCVGNVEPYGKICYLGTLITHDENNNPLSKYDIKLENKDNPNKTNKLTNLSLISLSDDLVLYVRDKEGKARFLSWIGRNIENKKFQYIEPNGFTIMQLDKYLKELEKFKDEIESCNIYSLYDGSWEEFETLSGLRNALGDIETYNPSKYSNILVGSVNIRLISGTIIKARSLVDITIKLKDSYSISLLDFIKSRLNIDFWEEYYKMDLTWHDSLE